VHWLQIGSECKLTPKVTTLRDFLLFTASRTSVDTHPITPTKSLMPLQLVIHKFGRLLFRRDQVFLVYGLWHVTIVLPRISQVLKHLGAVVVIIASVSLHLSFPILSCIEATGRLLSFL